MDAREAPALDEVHALALQVLRLLLRPGQSERLREIHYRDSTL
jgi:hypothetical protein